MAVTRSMAQRPSVRLPGNQVEASRNSTQELKDYYAMLLIVFCMILIPIWIVKYPGMVDYPNHLTRCYVLDHSPLPNLVIDLIVTPLLRILPLMVAGKVFLSLAAALYVLGCSAVGRAVIGKPNWLALVCAFTFYNSQLLFGFVNYVFGIGVFLCAFAFWLRIRNAMTPLRFFLCSLLSLAAYFAHLSSVVILGAACCTIALLDFVRDRKIRGLIVKLAWLASPILLMAGFLKNSATAKTIEWSTLDGKLIKLLAPIRSYSMAVDAGLVIVLLVCALALRKGCKVHFAAVVSLVLFALYLITPDSISDVSAIDARYVMPVYLLLILSIELRWGRWQKAALAVALAAMAIRTGSITADWLTISRRSEQVLAMGQILPQGARIYAFMPELNASKLDRGFIHVIQFWTVSRGADISTLFALPGQQPLVFRQPPCDGPEWEKCLSSYDFVWTYDPPASVRQDILRIATPAVIWEKVTLWRVDRKAVSSTGPQPDFGLP